MPLYNTHTHIRIPDDKETISIVNLSLPEAEQAIEAGAKTFFSVGIHPWQIKELSEQQKEEMLTIIDKLLQSPRAVAIGECGLDRAIATPLDQQLEIFRKQILLSEKNKKPLIIHNVRSHNEIIRLHQDLSPTQPWIVHGFRGKEQLANELIRHNIYLSFGYHFYKNIFTSIDMRKILLETDDLQNISIEDVYRNVAQDADISFEKLKSVIESNVNEIFTSDTALRFQV